MAWFTWRREKAQKSDRSAAPRANAPGAGGAASVEQLRRRARHRLTGAVILVLIAVIGFPLLFETEPRPEASDPEITIPDRDTAAPLSAPRVASGQVANSSGLSPGEEVVDAPLGNDAPGAVPPPATAGGSITPAPDSGAGEEPQVLSSVPDTEPDATAPEGPGKREVKSGTPATPKPAAAEAAKPAASKLAEAEPPRPARATTQANPGASDKPAAASSKPAAPAAGSGRFVIQIGAFADAASVRDARARVGKLGFSTFTQSVSTQAGARTRVRVGPFATRADADAAAAKLKLSGLPAQILPQ